MAELPWHINERACMRAVAEQGAHGVSMAGLVPAQSLYVGHMLCFKHSRICWNCLSMSENTPSIMVLLLAPLSTGSVASSKFLVLAQPPTAVSTYPSLIGCDH